MTRAALIVVSVIMTSIISVFGYLWYATQTTEQDTTYQATKSQDYEMLDVEPQETTLQKEIKRAKQEGKSFFAADPEEFIGFWEMLPLADILRARNLADPWPMPYQYFGIYANGEFHSYMSNRKAPVSAAELRKAFGMFPKKDIATYVFQDGFMIITHPDGIQNVWSIYVIRNIPPTTIPNAGDIIMRLDHQGKPVYTRYLRRLP